MPLITEAAALAEQVSLWEDVDYVAVDTEFTREHSYFPVLCVVQVATRKGAIAVDALAPGMDLTPIWQLCHNPNILKIFHSGSQDVEILCRASGAMPAPIFDTQIAALACGYGESIGYSDLTKRLLGVSLDKTHQYQDWSRRPLSETEIAYVIADVVYLHQLYPLLRKDLEQRGRMEWIAEELAALSVLPSYPPSVSHLWRRFRFRQFPPPIVEKIKCVLHFREGYAIEHNVPRQEVLSDKAIVKLVLKKEWDVSKVNAPCKEALALYLENPPIVLAEPYNGYVPLGEVVKERYKRWQALLRHVAEELQVVPRLIASKDELERLAMNPEMLLAERTVRCLQGWRYEVFGKKLG